MSNMGDMTTPRAAKDHRCAWCGEVISKGTQYKRFRGRWNGDWQNWGMHVECLAVSNTDGVDNFELYAGDRPHNREASI